MIETTVKHNSYLNVLNVGFELNADLNAAINLRNRLMNVSLKNSKLHKKDSFNRLLANTKNKYLIKDILQKNVKV